MPNPAAALEPPRRELEAFVTASLAPLDRVALERDSARQRDAMAFHLGAIDCLAEAHELDDTRALALVVMYLQGFYAASAAELGSATELVASIEASLPRRALRREGAEAMRRWRAGETSAAARLPELLALADDA